MNLLMNLKKGALIGASTLILLLVVGCDYVPRTIYKIQTVDREIIKLACPSVNAGRSVLTYITDGDCVVYRD